jgi:hypothetical protein
MYRVTQKKLKGLVGMARMLWKNRIGEQQTVKGYTFTIVNIVDVKNIEVEVNGEKIKVSKDVWKRGVFSKQIKQLNTSSLINELVGEEKIVKDVLFTIVGVIKNKLQIVADGCEHVFNVSKDVWNRGVLRNVFSDIKKLGLVVKKIIEKVHEIKEEKYELVIYNDFQKDFIGRLTNSTMSRIEKEFNRCMTISDVRKLYKHYARYTHPDLGFTSTANITCFEWLTALRDYTIAMIEYWLEDDED